MRGIDRYVRTAAMAVVLAVGGTTGGQAQAIESPESVYYRFMTNLVSGQGTAAAELMTFQTLKALRTEIMAITPVRSAAADAIWRELLGADRATLDAMADIEIVGRYFANFQVTNSAAEARAIADRVSIGAAQFIDGVAHHYVSVTVVLPPLAPGDKPDQIHSAAVERLVRTQDGWRLVTPTWSTRGIDLVREWVGLALRADP
ncbi:MAG: hypothetical protein SFV24_10120 [Gemmatimonadales bacterium]|nr:hypothetical protein [Gemmatimonadales bacterium]